MNFIKKNLENFKNLFSYIFDHLFCILFVIIIFVLSFLCLKFFPSTMPREIQSQEIYIFGISLNNLGILFTGVGLVVTAFWSIYQYTKSVSRKQQEKGAEIAKLFSDDFLDKCSVLGKIILNSNLNSLIKYKLFNYKMFKNFDRSELIELYGDTICQKIREVLSSDEIQQLYLQELKQRISFSTELNEKAIKYTSETAKELFIFNNSKMPFLFIDLLNNVLNTLEYISMYISSQSAGSKYVYQSLHQIYLKTVKLVAPIICLQNTDYSDKLYINIIYVYKEWCSLNEKDKHLENKRKNKIFKILNPKIKTV